MKKKLKIIIIIIMVFIGLIGGSILTLSLIYPDVIPVAQSMLNNHKRAYISDEDFNECFEDFEAVKNVAIKYYEAQNEKDYYLFMDFYYTPGKVYESVNNKPITLTPREVDSFTKIYDAFNNSGGNLERITFDNRFVTVETDNDRFAVVYSRDGSKPNAIIGFEDKGYSFYTRKVHDNWYSVTGT